LPPVSKVVTQISFFSLGGVQRIIGHSGVGCGLGVSLECTGTLHIKSQDLLLIAY